MADALLEAVELGDAEFEFEFEFELLSCAETRSDEERERKRRVIKTKMEEGERRRRRVVLRRTILSVCGRVAMVTFENEGQRHKVSNRTKQQLGRG